MPDILYKADASPPARAVMMVIDILGLNHIEQRDLNPVLRQQDAPEMKKLCEQNPALHKYVKKNVLSKLKSLMVALPDTERHESDTVLFTEVSSLNQKPVHTDLPTNICMAMPKKKNPMRTIPMLDEGDFWLADSHAIMIYLLEKYGKPEHSQLYPVDSRKRATVHQRLFFDCGILFQRLRAVMAPTYMGRLTEMSERMIRNIVVAYSMLEDYLSENLYMADDVITIADLSIVSTMATFVGLVPIDEKRFPKLKQWYNNMNETDYCKKINISGGKEHSDGLKALMANTKFQQKSKLINAKL